MTQAEHDLLLAVAAILENILQDHAGDCRDLPALMRAVDTVRAEDVRADDARYAEMADALDPIIRARRVNHEGSTSTSPTIPIFRRSHRSSLTWQTRRGGSTWFFRLWESAWRCLSARKFWMNLWTWRGSGDGSLS